MPSLVGQSNDPNVPGVHGVNTGDGGSVVLGRDGSRNGPKRHIGALGSTMSPRREE
jgi:hypothetical protein